METKTTTEFATECRQMQWRWQKPVHSNQGFTLIEVLIVAAIMAIMALSSANWFTSMASQMRYLETKQTLLGLKDEVKVLLHDPNVWIDTYNDVVNNSELKCLKNFGPNQTCSVSATGHPINVLVRGGAEIIRLNAVNGTDQLGFTKDGVSCTPFGQSNCPIRLELSWNPDCGSTLCPNTSMVKIVGTFSYIQSGGLAIRAERYNFEINRPGQIKSPVELCIEIGGTWNSNTSSCDISNKIETQLVNSCSASGGTWNESNKSCSLNINSTQCASLDGTIKDGKCVLQTYTSTQAVSDSCTSLNGSLDSEGKCILKKQSFSFTSCSAGQMMTGLNFDGSPICALAPTPTVVVGGSCSAGQMMTGLNANGSPICATPPTSATTTAAVASGSRCTGTLSGQSGTLQDMTSTGNDFCCLTYILRGDNNQNVLARCEPM